ncbi:MAG TPA: class I SAM-dependent methyltransferase [Flexivirga sp.]|uniref:class I SAM-dependent methyltransferase n=1 Tax=Flexivirga sp. TaxID=1962927 RepID=UPI002C856ACF|nr:class I SAM-dependent methyltransferase [Flexivirga sp.]HWC21184.1 class I SAM-dependent methyltransferase [Flexivirga sp.]
MPTSRAEREADLRTFYDNEASSRRDNPVRPARVAHRDAFLRLLQAEGRSSVVEVGTGPGRDSIAFRDAGFAIRGIDLAPASVALCVEAGLDVQVASALELPFNTDDFDAAYTASTLLHIADDDLDTALAELVRVVRPGSPIAIGVWGALETREQRWGDPAYGPPRFFALRSDDDLRAALARHGAVETFETWPADDDSDLHYQWAVLRAATPVEPHT